MNPLRHCAAPDSRGNGVLFAVVAVAGLLFHASPAQGQIAGARYPGAHSNFNNAFVVEVSGDGARVTRLAWSLLSCGGTRNVLLDPGIPIVDGRFSARDVRSPVAGERFDVDGVFFDADDDAPEHTDEQVVGGISYARQYDRCNLHWWATTGSNADDIDGWSDAGERRLGSNPGSFQLIPEHREVPTTPLSAPGPCRDFQDNDGDRSVDDADASCLPLPTPETSLGTGYAGAHSNFNNALALELSENRRCVTRIAWALGCGGSQVITPDPCIPVADGRFSRRDVPAAVANERFDIDGVFFDADGDGTAEQGLGGMSYTRQFSACSMRWWATAVRSDSIDGWGVAGERRLGSDPGSFSRTPEHYEVPTTPLFGAGVCVDNRDNDGDGSTDAADAGCHCGDGVVDAGEQCDPPGACCSSTCTFHPATVTCRPAAGTCDEPETCAGTDAACPPDVKRTGVCRPEVGVCDLEERCDGSSDVCPADAKEAAGTSCPDDGSVCTADRCDGTSADCQHPAGNAGTSCRAARGPCDVAETCTGASPTCPPDSPAPDGASCTDGQACTVADQCVRGDCSGTPRVCDDGNPCTHDTCDAATGQCVSTGSTCDDGNPCTDDSCGPAGCVSDPAVGRRCEDGDPCSVGETCQPPGQCSGGAPKDCTALSDECAVGTCDQATGECVTQPADDPQCTSPCLVVPEATTCPRCPAICGAGSCASGVGQCDVILPPDTVPPIIIVVFGAPGSPCKGFLVEDVDSVSVAATGPKAPQARPGKAKKLSKVARGRIRPDGELQLRFRLNRVGKKLLKERGRLRVRAQVRVRQSGGGGEVQLLERLITLLRRAS